MKDVVVRATEERDLPLVSDLTEEVFGKRRSEDVLGWLLGIAHPRDRIDSWVVERHGRVVGHTAILKSRYRVGERWATGAHAYLWMVEAGLRGEAGVSLARTIVSYDDFLIILGGTPTTQAILAGRRFVQAMEAKVFRFSSGGGESTDGFALAERDAGARSGAGGAAAAPLDGVIGNEAAPDHLEWLASCPGLEARCLELERDGRRLGPVLLYVNRRESPAAGRLVHLPYLGEDPGPWRAALEAVARELAGLGCSAWTLLATHPALVAACEAAGAEEAGVRPVWIRERKKVLEPAPWHLTFLEGDLAYRRVQ